MSNSFTNTGISTGSIPDFTKASKGAEEDNTAGLALKGIAKLGTEVIEVENNRINENLKQDVKNVWEEVNKPFTESELSKPLGTTPNEIVESKDKLARLQEAKDQGKLSDTAYYGRLVAATKELKAKYPGFEDEVDKNIMQVTGIRPANQLRSAVLAEVGEKDAMKMQKEREWDSFKKQNMDIIGSVDPEAFTNPDKYSSEEQRRKLMGVVAVKRGDEYKNSSLLREAAVSDKAWNERVTEARAVAHRSANEEVGQVISSMAVKYKLIPDKFSSSTDDAGAPNGSTDSVLSDIASGKIKLSPEQIQSMAAGIADDEMRLQRGIMERLSRDSNGRFSPEEVKSFAISATAPLRDIRESIQKGDFDAAGREVRSQAILQSRDQYSTYKTMGKDNRIYASLNRVAGEKVADAWRNDPEVIKGMAQVRSAISLDDVTSGNSSMTKEHEKIINDIQLTKSEKGGALKNLINLSTKVLEDKTASPDAFKNTFKAVYDTKDSILKHYSPESQLENYNKLTNPNITKRIMESGDEGMKRQYFDWATTQIKNLESVKNMANDVKTLENTGQYMSYSLSKDGLIVASLDQAKFDAFAGNAVQKYGVANAIKNTQKYVTNLNKVLSTYSPIIKGAGRDPQSETGKILGSLGVDLNARGNSAFQNIVDQISSGFTPEALDATKEKLNKARGGVSELGDWMRKSAPAWIATPFSSSASEKYEGQKLTKVSSILDGLGKAEGASYDTAYTNAQKKYGWKPSEMTVGEVLSAQKQLVKDTGSSAIGKYQFIHGTLKGLVTKLGIDPNEKFSPELQDKLALNLLEEQGLDDYLSGGISKATFQNRVSKVWASVPTTYGRSFYHGDSFGNKSSRAGAELASIL